jgi:hypothetical protein
MAAKMKMPGLLLAALLMLVPASGGIAIPLPPGSSVHSASYTDDRPVFSQVSIARGGAAHAATGSSVDARFGKGGKKPHHSTALASGSRAGRIKCLSCARDSHGRIKRSPEAKREFRKSHPCPSTGKTSGPCPGYVIDHIKALKRGGADRPYNMQWQTTEAARAKDRVE